MCTNHGYRHYPSALVRAAALLSRDDKEVIEVMLAAATFQGLREIAEGFEHVAEAATLATVQDLLDKERDATVEKSRRMQIQALRSWGATMILVPCEDAPF